MKYVICLWLTLVAGLDLSTAGDKIELRWKTLDSTTYAEAKKGEKKILVDVYTNWCGWCKRLDRDVYGNERIASYLDQRYVLVKINAESDSKVKYMDTTYTESGFAQALGVTGYPTIVFFDSDSKPITILGGYVGPEKFLPIAKFIGEDHYKKSSWDDFKKEYDASEKVGKGGK